MLPTLLPIVPCTLEAGLEVARPPVTNFHSTKIITITNVCNCGVKLRNLNKYTKTYKTDIKYTRNMKEKKEMYIKYAPMNTTKTKTFKKNT